MIAPLYKLGTIDDLGMIITALGIGILFGYLLISSGMGNARKISAVFYGSDWSVMKVMFSAVVTTMVLTYSTFYFGLLDLNLVQLANLNLTAQIVGGLLFGVGMVVGGYCPGTAMAAGITRKLDALIFLLGFVAGLWLFAANYAWISDVFYNDNLGKVTLSDIFNMSYGSISLMVIIVALSTFFLLEKTEGKLYGKPAEIG